MTVENFSRSAMVNNPEGSKSPQPQNPVPIEIVNVESLETQHPFRKTPLMRQIEERCGGKPIEEILSEIYWDQKRSIKEAEKDLGITRLTIFKWLHRTRVGVRSLNDAARVLWEKRRESGEMPVRKTEDSRTLVKYREAKKKLEIDSDGEFKAYLEGMYGRHKSMKAMVKQFKDRGIDVGAVVVKNWMLHLGIQLLDRKIANLDNVGKSLVEKAYNSGAFWALTPKQRDALMLIYGEKQTLNESARTLGLKDRRVIWDRKERGLKKLTEILSTLDLI